MKVGFLSDIHEDIVQLRRALEILDRVGCDQIVCLGDIVGFTPSLYPYVHSRDAEACVTMVRDRCSVTVSGNHDLYATRRVPEHCAGFDYGDDWYDLDLRTRSRRSRNTIWLYEDSDIPPRLSPASLDFLRGLPEYVTFPLDIGACMVSHSCYPDLTGSTIYFPGRSSHLQQHFQFLETNGCRIGVSGHGHPEGCLVVDQGRFTLHPFGTVRLSDHPVWIAAPSIARTSRASGCITLETQTMTVEIIPLKE